MGGVLVMNQKIDLTDDGTEFEKKVYVIADEVLNILKELSRENRKQINSKLIAEKMVWRDPIKSVLTHHEKEVSDNSVEPNYLKELSNKILDKFTQLMPSSLTEQLSDLKEKLHNKDIVSKSQDWLESPIKIIKKYIDSISNRNKELEEFMQQTMKYLAETEAHLAAEMSSQHKKFKDDRDFEDDIAANMNMIKQNVSVSGDLTTVKMTVLNKIENINKCIEKKREQDMQRLQETEKTIEEMSKRMAEIKREADEIRRRSQEIEFESVRDNLTGLYNRKAYDEKVIETLANLNRYNVPSSLMLCDIDYFKKINDNFGHKVGDLALMKLASLLKERLRINDFISRYGGEEFAIILPHTDLERAVKAGECIRSYIDKSVFSYKGQEIPLTISVGISSFRKDDDSTSVFERADHALYLAKRSGRNQVKTEEDVIKEGAVLNSSVLQS
jgi:diguanylate cyclase